jgi:hypothetical protein
MEFELSMEIESLLCEILLIVLLFPRFNKVQSTLVLVGRTFMHIHKFMISWDRIKTTKKSAGRLLTLIKYN